MGITFSEFLLRQYLGQEQSPFKTCKEELVAYLANFHSSCKNYFGLILQVKIFLETIVI